MFVAHLPEWAKSLIRCLSVVSLISVSMQDVCTNLAHFLPQDGLPIERQNSVVQNGKTNQIKNISDARRRIAEIQIYL